MRRGQWVLGVLLPVMVLLVGGLFWVTATARAGSIWAGGAKSDPASQTAVLVGAGDVVGCRDPRGALATAKLIEAIPGTVFVLGDLVYDAMTLPQFQKCYGGAWGKFKDPTKPTLGNHEYIKRHAAPYFQYWGAQAGPPGQGYYSYDPGARHAA